MFSWSSVVPARVISISVALAPRGIKSAGGWNAEVHPNRNDDDGCVKSIQCGVIFKSHIPWEENFKFVVRLVDEEENIAAFSPVDFYWLYILSELYIDERQSIALNG